MLLATVFQLSLLWEIHERFPPLRLQLLVVLNKGGRDFGRAIR